MCTAAPTPFSTYGVRREKSFGARGVRPCGDGRALHLQRKSAILQNGGRVHGSASSLLCLGRQSGSGTSALNRGPETNYPIVSTDDSPSEDGYKWSQTLKVSNSED